jgi:hypothetical protein
MARPQRKAFAASTADSTGMTRQSINRHLARAEVLGDDLDRLVDTSLDKGVHFLNPFWGSGQKCILLTRVLT